MKSYCLLLKRAFLPITILIISFLSTAEETRQEFPQRNNGSSINLNTIAAWILSFLVASVSSAGGIGGGSLYVPILNLVAGLNLKKSTTFSAFMVTGGSLSTVLYILLFMSRDHRGHPLINYDIAVLSQPCMLLGVSVGVLCNVVSPEWLITALFSLFLAFCTYKTGKAGVNIWRAETEEQRTRDTQGGGAIHEPFLREREEEEGGGLTSFPLKDVSVLVMVWLCFFLLHVSVGDKHSKVGYLMFRHL